ncbi:SET domain-containing protein [Jiangella mangrovi]|uniref:SET domain-containing protein-lysine N-methyltransferase n=1 Tax=Jiangella mangrovi TaxID=1524084 RepID=A0A7W9LL73_9ACTN|nr:SET domain-containing protein-lysine N-methyltransferase [Jiangella mangrovi]MBB5787812.1 hypothetical protein [Jiangella mangrovi]
MPSTSPPVPGPDTWLNPSVEPRRSPIHGTGLFARTDLPAGLTVSRLGGRLVTDAELQALFDDPAVGYVDTVSVYEDSNLVLPADAAGEGCNHGCDPDLWWADPFELRTRRPVLAGAELTLDYGTITDDPGFRLVCRCGSPGCRGVVTGVDWRRSELHERYGDHWVPVLRDRIAGTM